MLYARGMSTETLRCWTVQTQGMSLTITTMKANDAIRQALLRWRRLGYSRSFDDCQVVMVKPYIPTPEELETL